MQPTLIATFRYEDAPAAIDFLCNAFGFTRHVVYADETDPRNIHHAQLETPGGMIMLGSAERGGDATPYRWRTPLEAGGVTSAVYAIVADVEAHHARAVAAGAQIIRPPHDNDGYPGRGYEARDPGGYVWSFGSYDPWSQ